MDVDISMGVDVMEMHVFNFYSAVLFSSAYWHYIFLMLDVEWQDGDKSFTKAVAWVTSPLLVGCDGFGWVCFS